MSPSAPRAAFVLDHDMHALVASNALTASIRRRRARAWLAVELQLVDGNAACASLAGCGVHPI
jgi:hypothetical protein